MRCKSMIMALMVLMGTAGWLKAGEVDVAETIRRASAGTTVRLPAGTFRVGDVEIPAGVSVRGAGYNATVLDATGFRNGLVLRGEGRSSVSDLMIQNASENGILVADVPEASIERVVVRSGVNGIMLQGARKVRIANTILVDNRTGLVMLDTVRCTAVNLTIANNAAMGILLSNSSDTRIFNNLVVFSELGIRLNGQNPGLMLDHNLYVCNFTGSMDGVKGLATRAKVPAWHALSGHDGRSLMLPVVFHDAGSGDYRVANRLSWAPHLTVNTLWGVQEFGEAHAPSTDIDEQPRGARYGVGAHAGERNAPVPAEAATFHVKRGDGAVSAGLYTSSGDLVAYLFQNLPLAAGDYDYVLPGTDWQGQPIAPGAYTLRVTEANLSLEYVAAAGNGDESTSKQMPRDNTGRASQDVQMATFGEDGKLFVAQSGFETHVHLRSFSHDLRQVHWSLKGGGETVGLTTDDKGRLFMLRKNRSLVRLDAASGEGIPFADGSVAALLESPWTKDPGLGMGYVDGQLVLPDPAGNQLLLLDVETLSHSGRIEMEAPSRLTVDASTGYIWVIRQGGKIVAVAANGEIKALLQPVENPTALSAANARLAVYSKASNQISIFDISDPGNLTLLRVIGTGGDGFGPIQPDRFWSPRHIALSPSGQLAVVDPPRMLVFDAEGHAIGRSIAMWGQQISAGQFAGDDRMHFFLIGGGFNIALDAKRQTWEPVTRWRYSMPARPVFFFTAEGRNFGVAEHLGNKPGLLVFEMNPESGQAKAVLHLGRNADGETVAQKSPRKDGIIRDDDPAIVLVSQRDSKTQAFFANTLHGRHANTMRFRENGDLLLAYPQGPLLVPMTGLDADGVPMYAFDQAVFSPVRVGEGRRFRSPYDFVTEEDMHIREEVVEDIQGNYVAGTYLKGGAGPDLATEHGSETDVAGIARDGRVRWINPLNPIGLKEGFFGLHHLLGVTLAGRGARCEFETMDVDGLGTGLLGMPADMAWGGMWLDNARQSYGFVGNDGKPYLIIGDYAAQSYHWLALQGYDSILRHSLPVRIDEALAQALAQRTPEPVPHWPVPPIQSLVIKRLAEPLPIDDNPATWRGLGITPLLITPELAQTSIGPDVSSAVARFAWYGTDLYVQVIKFDNAISIFQQDIRRHYLQDGIEIAINSYAEGFKYNLTIMDGEPIVYRDTWRGDFGRPELNTLLPTDVAPRSITIHADTALLAPERRLIESATGVSLEHSKAMVFAVRIPQSVMTPMEDPQREVVFESGRHFRLGIMINDNDVPGVDALNPIVWPVTYSTFERPDRLATAVFE